MIINTFLLGSILAGLVIEISILATPKYGWSPSGYGSEEVE